MINKVIKFIVNYFKNLNVLIFFTTLLLIFTGILSIYSATYSSNLQLFYKQIIWYSLGLLLMLIFSRINYNLLIGLSIYFYYFIILLLIIVLIIGQQKLGAQRWLKIGPLQIQPSEFAKFIIMLVTIRFILINHEKTFLWKNIIKLFIILFIPFILILKQPDLGTSILFFPIIITILFIGNIPIKRLITIFLIILLLTPVSYFFLKDYQKKRLMVFLNPSIDKLGAGYNVIQSQIAVGSGGFYGKGWLQGTQSQLNFIPIKYTDFIFAVIGEEFGFLGSMWVLLLYFILIMEILRLVKLTRSNSAKMLASSIGILIFSQVAINIGMNIGIMPVTGITLPLLSYGGSSILVFMILLGILQNIYFEYIHAEE